MARAGLGNRLAMWRALRAAPARGFVSQPEPRSIGLFARGRQLLAGAMARADWAPQFLTLMVAHVNTSARAFYEAVGFGLRDDADQLILEGEGLRALMSR